MKGLTFKRVHWLNRELFDAFMELYEASFPWEERRSRQAQCDVLTDAAYHCHALLDGNTFVGLVCLWETGPCHYLEHLAIAPQYRGRGYGQEALRRLQQEPIPLVLDIEPPVDEPTRRRLVFYEKLAFRTNPHDHKFPPYHLGQEPFPMLLLSYPAPLSAAQHRALSAFLFQHTRCEDSPAHTETFRSDK